MLLAVALGAGLLTAGFTLPPPQPPQPPSAPAGELADIPGFLPDTATRTALPPRAGAADDADAGRAGADDGRPAGPDDPGEGAATGPGASGAAPGDPTPEQAGTHRAEAGVRSLTATRAPASPPPIPPAGSTPAGDDPAGVGPAGVDPAGAGPAGATGAAGRAGTTSDTAGGTAAGGTTGRRDEAGQPGEPPTLPRVEPLRIGIPAIGVDAEIIAVGVDSQGELEVPPLERPMLAGWYRLGPSPGEPGNSVIVGHVNTRRYGRGVFFDLGRLRQGDLITVTRADGTVVRFAVDDVRLFPKPGFPSQAVYGGAGPSRLRVVTCGGRYDRNTRDYLDNLVVFASRLP